LSGFDPLKLARETEKLVVNGALRKHYRVGRVSRWYGGIAESHCCGCCLRCVFCWSGVPRDHPERVGEFYSAEQIFELTSNAARKHGIQQLRITGNEPTLGREHLLRLLALVDESDFRFILETNGLLIGADASYARDLAKFRSVHVRVSLKATNPSEFCRLTGADPNAFNLQLRALENLLEAGVSCNPAVMTSFTTDANIQELKQTLSHIHPSFADNLELETVILYPPVVKRLKEAGIQPKASSGTFRGQNYPIAS
jgi:uncharacterized Fe-S cluster-containing radical SAM superfamily protein